MAPVPSESQPDLLQGRQESPRERRGCEVTHGRGRICAEEVTELLLTCVPRGLRAAALGTTSCGSPHPSDPTGAAGWGARPGFPSAAAFLHAAQGSHL